MSVLINGRELDEDATLNVFLVTCRCGWTTVGNQVWAYNDWQDHAAPHPRKCKDGTIRPLTAGEWEQRRKEKKA